MSSFFIQNFGCRATQADGAAMERQLLERGMGRVEAARHAEVVVLNTCTVTAEADRDARAAIRRIHRENPRCKILVTGCYAQRAPQELASLPGVAWVVGNSHKHQVAEIVAPLAPKLAADNRAFVPLAQLRSAELHIGDIFAHTELMAAPVFDGSAHDKTRPNLKVQDGCDNRCSFCIIPFVRGQSRSLKLPEVLNEMNALVAAGYREVVISGINLGRWGRDFNPQVRFENLARAILEHTDVERLRLSSIEPMDWTDELIELVAGSPRMAKHAHVPLQSGCDRILRRMHRRYRPWHYAERIRKVRAVMPDGAIGADVMAGFPGESDSEFEENRAFIAALPFTYLHVFTYSERPGTPAASMPNQVPMEVRRERNRILRELGREKNFEFRRAFVGRTLSAITLSEYDGQCTAAISDNYLKVRLRGRHAPNQLVEAEIVGVTADGVDATVYRGQAQPPCGSGEPSARVI
ncbi:MAG TPA: tRNA (N(6)-L-threonylcarbamoyladenosine(37)-C(2))-methylthiotransferase MtaB [Terriglobales bacterium]|nr:tRNA (N(6)-L-threonylcarbamoyladenosine(37)-C(2))-methylthiotransferase MtaB [Terriglobales bacterium]